MPSNWQVTEAAVGQRIARSESRLVLRLIVLYSRDGRLGSLRFRYAQNRRHFVFLAGRQSDGCGQDVARLDTEELSPFAIT